jgi:mono/diheme cytochrome c family protein
MVLSAAAFGAPRFQGAEGKALYDRLCASCHGATGAGNGPAAAAFKTAPTNFLDAKFQKERSDEQLTIAVTQGKPPMPGYGKQLSPAQVKSLVAYIRQLGRPSSE